MQWQKYETKLVIPKTAVDVSHPLINKYFKDPNKLSCFISLFNRDNINRSNNRIAQNNLKTLGMLRRDHSITTKS